MLALALLSTITTVGLGGATQPACSLADCLRRLAAIERVETVSPVPAELLGTWSFGGGLSGSSLYLFEDQSYILTEWADIMPETVYHKGTWQVVDRVLTLAVDADVTWDRPSEHRLLVYRAKAATAVRLLGLERMLGFLEESIREIPGHNAHLLKAASFSRRSGWQPGEGARRKGDVIKKCWKPDYFANSR